MKILTFNGVYIPGFKAGGPIRSLVNMVSHLKDHVEFHILTRDRDAGDTVPYENIEFNKWLKLTYEYVYYQSEEKVSVYTLKKVINRNNYDIVLLNGVFSEYTTSYLILRKFKLIKFLPTIIMPRGDLAKGALSLKAKKKSMFLKIAKVMGLYDNLVWLTTSDTEMNNTKQIFKNTDRVFKIANLPNNNKHNKNKTLKRKAKGELRVIYIARITKVKNLLFALNVLSKVQGRVNFDIYGPIEDEIYWNTCKSVINNMKDNVKVTYHGSIPHDTVKSTMRESDVLLLPTLGENYGHVIVEAISCGIPVVISDQTPWENLQFKNVGWDISLNNEIGFVNAIQKLINMGQEEYNKYEIYTEKYINETLKIDKTVEEYKKLFEYVSKLSVKKGKYNG